MGVVNFDTVEGVILGDSVNGTYLRDALGSVTATIPNKVIANTYRYKPYGSQLAKTGSSPDPKFLWIGTAGYRETSISHSASYVRARHYGQKEGRWATVDPLWPWQASYGYVSSAPTNGIDPSGLQVQIVTVFCPPHTGGLPPCASTRRGGCPNQSSAGGMVSVDKFGQKGKPDEISKCDPVNIDRGAIQRRIDELQRIANDLCGHPSGDPIPPGGGGYDPWVETIPCWIQTPGIGQHVSCNIKCYPGLSSRNRLGGYFDKGKPQNGIGCLACCLMVHENTHCLQIILGGARDRTYGIECQGFRAEIACLQRVLKGKACS